MIAQLSCAVHVILGGHYIPAVMVPVLTGVLVGGLGAME